MVQQRAVRPSVQSPSNRSVRYHSPVSTPHSVRGVLLDLDGVVYQGDAIVPGARGFLFGLAAAGIGIVAITNHAGRSPAQVSSKLAELGLRLGAGSVVTSACVTATFMAAQSARSVRVVGTPSLARALTDRGVRVDPASSEAVVVGYAPEANFDELAAAARAVHAGAMFVATNDDGAVPAANGIWPDAGPTVAFIAAASGRAPIVVGKPAPWLFEEGLRRLALDAVQVVMVGDTLATDIVGGNAVGCRTLWLHASGTVDVDGLAAPERPTWSVRGLDEATAILVAAARRQDDADRTSVGVTG